MEKTLQETKELIWFRTEIPGDINEALKDLARQKSRRNKRSGISFTKEGIIVAILEQAIEAKKTGSLKTFASWLFDGEYRGNISEAPPGEGKISCFSSTRNRPIPAALNSNSKGKPAKRLASLTTV